MKMELMDKEIFLWVTKENPMNALKAEYISESNSHLLLFMDG